MPSKKSKPRIYKYKVTGIWGDVSPGNDNLVVGEFVIENHYRGKETDWTVMDMKTGKEIWGFSGTFVEKLKEEPKPKAAEAL